MAKRIFILTSEEAKKMNAKFKLPICSSEGEETLLSLDSQNRDVT